MAAGGRKAGPGEAVEVHCRGCKRRLGIAPADYRIYCDAICAADFSTSAQEQRDALIETMFREDAGLTQSALASLFGVSRQLVNKILTQRDLHRESA